MMKNRGKEKDIFGEILKFEGRLKEELEKVRVEGSSGGGMVKIEMDGEQNVLSVKIEPQVIEEKDINMLQDLIAAAFNDAQKKLREKTKEIFSSLTGLPFF
jgi:DNA-binding YbaB/EbfC family protein|uniref:Nucleoid-associated protein ENX68_01170 n=1 Tax=candidate division WOR-3 bacterium TaxID=2052148 RepID=A0A7V3RG88_UNCW3